MRKRYAVALMAAVSLAVTGGWVYADPFTSSDGADPASAAPSSTVVTLPGGDRLQVPPRGPLVRLDGRSSLSFSRLPDGDRVVIPHTELSEVYSGRSDQRLYNVDAMLRNGYTDARKVDDPSRLGRRPANDSGAAANTKVTVKATWVDGSKPMAVNGVWMNLDTGDSGQISGDGGTGTAKLPPGDYGFALNVLKKNNSIVDLATTTADLTVTGEPATITMDGKKAKPLGFKVDAADARGAVTDVGTFVGDRSGKNLEGTFSGLDGRAKLYAIPADKPDGHQAGVSLQSTLTSPSGADKPYNYNLVNIMTDGIPDDPMTTVHDDELAARDTTYRGMGGQAAEIARGDYADTPLMEASEAAFATTGAVPSKRTEYFTASPDVKWGHIGQLDPESSPSYDVVQRYSGAMSAGKEEAAWLSAPVSVGLASEHDWMPVMARLPYDKDEESPQLVLRPALFDSGDADESMGSWGVDGKATISKDGQTLASSDDGSEVGVHLPKDDSGRYTATFDAKRDVKWTPLGTESRATWEFDSQPVNDTSTPLEVSTVRFNATGITDGYADSAAEQDVTLDFVTQGGAADRSCADMTFEVSYDDGKTWKKVEIARDGDQATAKLKHPEDAKFVSVKFSAKDDKGQTVETSTIRSYGLN